MPILIEDDLSPVPSSDILRSNELVVSPISPVDNHDAEPQGYLAPPEDSPIFLKLDSNVHIFLDICCGHNAPLSTAMRSHKCDVLAFDILLDPSCDLLADSQFERLLRLCNSGAVRFCATSPACREYSRLKLKPGGPPALRTPAHLDGVPGLDAHSLLQVQESHTMLSRCVLCIRLTHSSGNHGHLEQPLTAMSWSEPIVQDYIRECSCTCSVISACQVGKDWAKAWLFAGTNPLWETLAKPCDHPPHSHQNIAGVRTEHGTFLSRETAEYPPLLCSEFAETFCHLCSANDMQIPWSSMESVLPLKPLNSPPFAECSTLVDNVLSRQYVQEVLQCATRGFGPCRPSMWLATLFSMSLSSMSWKGFTCFNV